MEKISRERGYPAPLMAAIRLALGSSALSPPAPAHRHPIFGEVMAGLSDVAILVSTFVKNNRKSANFPL
jgi:hypothetical protein